MELQYTIGGETFTVPLSGKALTIGRKPSCDVQVEHPSISSVHVKIELKGHEVELCDLGSSNGTIVGGSRQQHATLRCGDRFRLGAIDFVITGKGGQSNSDELPRMYLIANLQGEEKRFPLAKSELTVGRKEECDIEIDDISVSGHHVTLNLTRDGLNFTDLGSANGTFLNGEKKNSGIAHHGDRLRIGKIELRVYSGGGRTSARLRSGYSAAPRSMTPLFLLIPDEGGPHVALSAGPATVGRKDPASVILDDPSISSQHLRIEVSPSGIRFTDLDSANGTYLNDNRVFRGVLQPGDSLRLGRLRFTIAQATDAALKAGSAKPKPSAMAMVGIAAAAAAIVFIIGGAFLFLPSGSKKPSTKPDASSGATSGSSQVMDEEAAKLQAFLAQQKKESDQEAAHKKQQEEARRLAEQSRKAAEAAKQQQAQKAAAQTKTTQQQPTKPATTPATKPAATPAAKTTPAQTTTKPAQPSATPKTEPAKPASTTTAKPAAKPVVQPAPKPAVDPTVALKSEAAKSMQTAAPLIASLATEMDQVAATELSQKATEALQKAGENYRKVLELKPEDKEAKEKLEEIEASLFWCQRLPQ